MPNAILVVEPVISRENVPTKDKIAQDNTQNGPRRTNQVCKITVNMDQNLRHKDATVNAMVGMGGKMLKCRLLMDSGADFSCVSNEVLLRMQESGMAVAVESDFGCQGFTADGSPLKVVGKINLDVKFKLTSGKTVLVNWTFVVMKDLNREFIIGMDVLRQIGFGVERDSLWIGNGKSGKICSLRHADQETLYLRCKITLGNETWCLYKVADPIEKRPTSIADSNWSMSRADGPKLIFGYTS